MVDDIVYKSLYGKSDISVLIITFRCYAEIANSIHDLNSITTKGIIMVWRQN